LWLAGTPDFTVVAEAATVQEALRQMKAAKPEIVLLDINLPEKNGYDTLRALKVENKNLIVLVIGNHPEKFYAMDMVNKGAHGYFAIHDGANELINTMRSIIHNDSSPPRKAEITPSFPHEKLNAREYEVFLSLCSGDKPAETARKLALSLSTVNKYKKRVFTKINVDNQLQLIRYAVHHHIFEPFRD
jgi:two-component system invasion response regulator UvrY